MTLKWNDGDRNGTGLVAFLDLPRMLVEDAIAKLEAAAGTKGEWVAGDCDCDMDGNAYNLPDDWWGLHGTFGGEVFTVYTHKSGTLKIGGDVGLFGDKVPNLDVTGLKAALLAIVTA